MSSTVIFPSLILDEKSDVTLRAIKSTIFSSYAFSIELKAFSMATVIFFISKPTSLPSRLTTVYTSMLLFEIY